ncbi:Glu-tRNA(Gln) amidotransferase GatDE subunit E [Candidatus Parvarchaeota archaeon]|nr:MAG: Glu-tRNA(Gln) amidotransferase GatDE subunit E [Candidatus Parvarchaeota archaeon]HIG51960.1 Glu-tRNA(Gln) amidotransferase subunit GatE [Candidatus Pacearchaeota archaeon]
MKDYEKLGFKAGLEIHQQLDTHKLFSDSPSFLRNDEPDYLINRKLHAIAGESGEIDIAVKHEALLDKEFFYEGYNDTVSLVELDEEPPRNINEEALEIALQISLLLNCEIYPITQVMRKTVIDGSNTSGFQRTVLIAHNGFIETSFGKVLIESVALEEDSARIISREEGKAIYRLDRLGIPLVEITTAPDIFSSEQIKEAALKIGDILRSCKVKRGIGTIRQDVNVSIKGHDRVEIKGFQDPKMMVETADKEIERQLAEIKKGESIGCVRNALPDGTTKFLRPLPGRARMYPETDLELLKINLEKINKIKKNLPELRSNIRKSLKKRGLTEELINLVLAGHLDEFTTLMKVYKEDPILIAKMITIWRSEFSKKMKKSLEEIEGIFSEAIYEKILEKIKKGILKNEDVREVLINMVQGQELEEAIKIEKINDDELEEKIRKLIKKNPGLRVNAYMGIVIKEMKGKIDARKAMEIIKKIVTD